MRKAAYISLSLSIYIYIYRYSYRNGMRMPRIALGTGGQVGLSGREGREAIYIYVYMYIYIYTSVYTSLSLYLYISLSLYIYIYIYIHVYYEAILAALKLGYRAVDTSEMSRNLLDVGWACWKSGVPRREVFIIAKIAPWNHGLRGVRSAFARQLAALRVDYVDLLLLQWPHVWDPSQREVIF